MYERRRKKYLTRKHERFMCGFVHTAVFTIYLFELFYVLPTIYPGEEHHKTKLLHVVFGTVILFNWIASYWKFLTTDTTSGSSIMPGRSLQGGWFYCWACQSSAPPRSFHCESCGVCVLVRDHHCIISSNCLGHKTRRYFILMCFYFWLALLYSNILNYTIAVQLYETSSWRTIVVCMLPGIAWLMGIFAIGVFSKLFIITMTFMFFCYSSYLFHYHLVQTIHGRTTHEFKHDKGHEYDISWQENLRQAMGENWRFGWVCPLIPSRLPGDGCNFNTRKLPKVEFKNL